MVNEIIGQCSRIIFLLTSFEYSALSRALFVLKMADGCAPDGRVVGALASAAQLPSAVVCAGFWVRALSPRGRAAPAAGGIGDFCEARTE